MGIQAKWTTTCDGCGLVSIIEHVPGDNISGYLDIFSPGFPDEWLQVSEDEVTRRQYLFFHSRYCYKNWLQSQGRYQEATEFDEGVWIA